MTASSGKFSQSGCSLFLPWFSIFCIANPRSVDFTRIYRVPVEMKALVFLSICLDWQYISGSLSPIWILHYKYYSWLILWPPSCRSLWKLNFLIASDVHWACEHLLLVTFKPEFALISGSLFPRVVFCGVYYYMNIWKSKSFTLVCTTSILVLSQSSICVA